MIFILAQGAGSRWEKNDRKPEQILPANYKQQIVINGEAIIMRTVRMIEEYTDEPFVVIAEGVMFSHPQLDRLTNKVMTLHYPGNILHGVWQLLQPGSRRNYTFLLGDVVYSKQALADILSYDEREYTLWGRDFGNLYTGKEAQEIFALTVAREAEGLLKEQLTTIKETGTKLWHLYHHWLFSGNFETIGDYTDDIDSIEEYEQFFDALEKAVKEDE